MADIQGRAKRHKLLDDLFTEVKLGFLEAVVEVRGHKYKLTTPTEDDEVWADTFIKPSTPISFVSSRRAPRLACAIREIDGIKTSELFLYPDDMEESVKKSLRENPVSNRYWLYTQVMWYLSELPTPIITEIYKKFDEIVQRRDEAFKEAVTQGPNS